MIHGRWLLPILLALCPAVLAAAPDAPEVLPEEAPVRILAVEEPPASYLDDKGQPAGFAVDVVQEIQRRLGTRAPITVEPETRVYETGLRQPNVVLLSFSRQPEREESFYWLQRIIRKPWNFYARSDDTRRIESLDDVRALERVAVIAGDVRARWLQREGLTNLLPAQTHEQAIRLLLAKRVDVVFSEPQGIAWFCRAAACGEQPPRVVWTPRVSEVYIMLSKRGTSPELARRWQDAAAAVRQDGTLDAIGQRWAYTLSRRFGVHATWRGGVLDFCTSPC